MYSKLILYCFLGTLFVTTSIAQGRKVVCYYGSWAVYRPGLGSCNVEHINPRLCTHLIYAFIGINEDGTVRILDSWNDIDLQGFKRFNNLRQINPNAKTLIAIGGWNEGSEKYSKVAANPALRQNLINSAINLMSTYGFDGFDFDWEYPGDRGGGPEDKANFATLIKELRQAFGNRYLLSIASGATAEKISTSYDVPTLSQHLDFINVMTYDLQGVWDGATGHNAPLTPNPSVPGFSVSDCIDAWINNGANPSKIVMGIPVYGRTFTLANQNDTGIGSISYSPGQPGPYTQESGMLGYNELCTMLNDGWTTVWDNVQQVPYAYKEDQWVSYDNPQSVSLKMQFVRERNLGGAMIWSIETDDFQGTCGAPYPILTTINNGL